jgi:hypothetical protein
LRRRSGETEELVFIGEEVAFLVGGLSVRRLGRGVRRRLLENEPLDEELDDAVEGAVGLLGKAAQRSKWSAELGGCASAEQHQTHLLASPMMSSTSGGMLSLAE